MTAVTAPRDRSHRFSPPPAIRSDRQFVGQVTSRESCHADTIEERVALTERLSAQADDQNALAARLEAKRQDASHHADQIRQMLLDDGDWYSIVDL